MTDFEPVPDLSLDLPPMLTGRPVVPPDDPFAVACGAAAAGEAVAGDLFWSPVHDRVAMALVLEPEVPRARSMEMLFTLMVAAADSIGALGPPELAFTWQWPNRLFANDASVGQVAFKLSDSDDPDGAPDWLVVGIEIACRQSEEAEPGRAPDRTSLWDEGAVDLSPAQIVGSLSRHFLTWLHRWETDGFKPVHEAWLFRCDGYRDHVQVPGTELAGEFIGLDDSGNLLLKQRAGGVLSNSLSEFVDNGLTFAPNRVRAGA